MNLDWGDTPREAEIRAEARAWLEANWPPFARERNLVGKSRPYPLEDSRAWQRVLYEGGWSAPAWPAEHGGRGFGPVENSVWAEEKARAGANVVFDIVGFGMAGPTIVAHGTEEQKARYLPPLLRGDEIWCQLFSEPGAGSDLAGVTTQARSEGDEWIVNGQKVWSSDGGVADRGILLARFDPDVPKHRGLVYLLVDMHSPGVEVRPLRQLSGDSHFSEVFLTDVRVPDSQRMGEPGAGWGVAMTTLMNERMSLGASTAGLTFPFTKLVELARARGMDELTRHDLVRIWTRDRILEVLNKRVIGKLRKGEIPTAEGSVLKLLLSQLTTDAANTGVHLLGPAGATRGGDGSPQLNFLWAPAMRIGGGTDEIQRNTIAERVLGLPREPRPDREVPFSNSKV
jgi:alkylation response protein AidB-like acyl-CoA dehydrogenase